MNCLLPPPGSRPALPLGARLIGNGCRFLLAAVFLMAAVSKITDLATFEDQVVLHSPLPYRLGVVVAAVLPWLELTCGLCLVLGFAVREAALLTAFLSVLFLCHSLAHEAEISCHCFEFPISLPQVPKWWHFARNLFLLLCSLWISRR
jgi:putative oxidoreductase